MKAFLTEWLIKYGVERVVASGRMESRVLPQCSDCVDQGYMLEARKNHMDYFHWVITPKGLKLIGEPDESIPD